MSCGYNGCDEDEEIIFFNINLCLNHKAVVFHELKYTLFTKEIAKLYLENKLHNHSEGFCYIVELPTGNIKIGYSSREDLLYSRFTSLHRENQDPSRPSRRLKILAILEGGVTLEAVLHEKFNHLRLRNVFQEQFINSSEILLFAKSIDMPEAGKRVKLKYSNYQPR